MEEISSGVDPDELMDLEEPETYDLDEEEEEIPDDSATSPFQHFSSGPASAATSAASSPLTTDDFSPPFNFAGKPLTIKRGRGRPRREGGKLPAKRGSGGGVPRVRRAKPISLSRCRGSRSARIADRMDFDLPYISPSSLDDLSLIDGDGFFFPDRDRPAMSAFEDIPYAPETWSGKVCAFCNLSERSQLGQSEILRLNCPEGFTPQRMSMIESNSIAFPQVPEKDSGDKSPRGPVTCRRTKNFSRARSFLSNNEHIDELTIIGYSEEPSVNVLFEPNGQFYVHRACALWSAGVIKTENQALENVGPVVLQSSSKKCSFCNHYGASLVCKTSGCSKNFHFPCATASGAFQDRTTLTVYCNNHLGDAAMRSEAAICNTCKNVGDIANLMYCSMCGTHYHGSCVGLAQLPGVRAGWQCRKCRICQVCRIMGDESKLMTCEQCDKVYHASCQRPIVTSIPKYGWKCRCCRVCGDCGSRTPGAGLSSRWHLHYTVCDSCYQQRNKGCCCPICQRAYRSHAHREMVQCTMCRKFVHGTCDPEADLTVYQQKRDANPEYEYVCVICKNMSIQQQMQLPGRQLTKRSSTDDPGDLSASQESLYDDMSEFDSIPSEDSFRCIGLGKGKPYASKIAKKRLSYSTGMPGRPKGSFGKGYPGKQSFMKRQRLTDFGRKRGPKAKIRGVFGVPGVGLSRPVADGKSDEEPGVENRLVLCSAKDKFVLTQDICVMCGALGTDQEGCLIACVQCGQCYHPYCINVKVTKVILQKGWRCLDCTVCEGCGQRNDEGRLILCDDCDVSYHTYCMDPPLDYVPHGNWKCKWCACCRTCGAADPGFNCNWMNGCTECGPCASHTACPSCGDPYSEGDLIIQCVQCERWLHGICDLIKTEQDAEKCAEEGYTCLLCRPRDVPPPHLIPAPAVPKPPTPTKSPEVRLNANFFVDGVCLNESGHSLIKSLSLEYHGTRKKRKKVPTVQDKEAGIMATIESVVAGGSAGENSFDDTKIEMMDIKDEPQELYKEGMIWTKEDGPPPEGFTVFTMESGICVLRRKRQRNLQKLGIGGFLVRMRGFRNGQENDDIDTLPGQTTPTGKQNDDIDTLPGQTTPTGPEFPMSIAPPIGDGDKPKKKPIRRKPKCKLAETFPSYLQEAFFGKDLLDVTDLKKEMESGSSDEEKGYDKYQAIRLSAEELMAVESAQQEKNVAQKNKNELLESIKDEKSRLIKDEDDENTEDLKDVLALPGDLLDTDLVNSIINEEDDELTKNTELEALGDEGELTQNLGSAENSKDAKDELSDILGSHFTLESIPNINSKDVEDIFKGVLTDESQESQLSQESTMFPTMQTTPTPMFTNVSLPSSVPIPQMPLPSAPVRPTALPGVQHVSFPPSPYHSEYSNSPQFSPAFSEPPSPWVNINDGVELDNTNVGVPSTYNQRSSEKMKADEGLGSGATISAVLYANMNQPEWKTEFPIWSDRYKQIIKKWRTLTQDQKAPYLQQARDNRSQLRMKKQQQSQNKEPTTPSPSMPVKPPLAAPPAVTKLPSPGPSPVTQAQPTTASASEVCNPQRTPAQPLTHASTCSVSISSHRPSSPPPRSPPTHQQFTVHGHFAGPGDRVGPAPNVTVNPNYQPNPVADHAPLLTRSLSVTQQSSSPSASDQQIRVLTPSEIMRTLPSLCQESYEPQQPDQEKITQQQKSVREAEQERQWKQLQALRQQQAQQQQHVIHEQRVQAIARVQRTVSDPASPFVQTSQASPLQVSTTPQEVSPSVSPSPASRPFIGIKSPPFPHSSSQPTNIRTSTPSQSPVHEFPQQPQKSQTPDSITSEAYIESPTTPKSTAFPKIASSAGNEQFGQPTPRPPFASSRASVQVRPEQPEINRQLRDLLQRQQQLKNFDFNQAKSTQRIWNPNDTPEGETSNSGPGLGEDTTFRQPLPPGSSRPRMPLPLGVRPGLNIRMQQVESRLQSLDPRMRLILQQQQRLGVPGQQQLVSGALRFGPSATARPATIEQYEQLLQRQAQLQTRNVAMEQCSNTAARLPLVQTENSSVQKPRSTEQASSDGDAAITQSQSGTTTNEQEIPDNVTAELEKLEQETGTMAELQGVSEILGGLGDDDDELLAEMGADFNILEYADPELEALAGEKTNILDLDLEDDHLKQERKKEAMQQKQNASSLQSTSTTDVTTTATTPTTCTTTSAPEEIKTGPVPSLNLANAPNPERSVESQPSAESVLQQQTQSLNDNVLSQPQPSHQSSPSTPSVPDAASQSTPTITSPAPTPISNSQVAESPPIPHSPPQQMHPAFTTQQIHQQMLHQVQQAAAQGRPMPPGSKLQTPDGIVGIVLANNNVQLQIPPNFQQRLLLQLQNQKLQMRVGRTPGPRVLSPGLNQPQQQVSGPVVRPRMVLPPRPPPPPPYPGPPPPYPGKVISQQQAVQQQMGLRMGPGVHHHMGLMHPLALQGFPIHPHFQRRPLLLEEQPLLLEDLLEQEKREQEKQHQTQPSNVEVNTRSIDSEPSLLSDHDFERLRADVFSGGHIGVNNSSSQGNSGNIVQQHWQQNRPTSSVQPTTEITTRVQMFNANLLPAPPLPPENIVSEQDKQAQIVYEQWLNHQNNVLTQQLRYYETEVQKLRKGRKSLNSKQRQLRKSGNQLNEADSNELQRISAEQAILQKHLESSRKQSRQHGMLIQEYRNKQQPTKPPVVGATAQLSSPLGPPASSPIHHPATSQSPMLSPQQSPLAQHISPMNSPGPMIAHSPGPGSVAVLLQSPGGSVSPMQPSPRIGTPLSQGEGSPGPVQSPSQVCLPPPVPRMTSPQHRRVVTSPVGYSGDVRSGAAQMRFVRPPGPVDHSSLQQRIRNQTPSTMQNFSSKIGTPSPLNSPPLNQMSLVQQQLLQKQMHQQALLQQHQQQNSDGNQSENNVMHSPRVAQLIQHRNLSRHQQINPPQGVIQPQPLTPQQHQLMVQQQQQLAKQQQQQQIAMQLQARLNQQQQQQSNPPHSPIPPKSPLHSQQIMSPHSMPTSPMPPKSPMLSFSTNQQSMPSSPVSRNSFQQNTTMSLSQPPSSPMMHQYQTPNSPMIQSPHAIRRPPSASSSPAMPERPTSVENPSTPRTPYNMDNNFQEHLHSGGGNPNNPTNPIPLPPPGFGKFGYFKLGLRGGAPMWSGFGRGEKRVPTPPTSSAANYDCDKQSINDPTTSSKPKKESHINKVSILKKKGSLPKSGSKPSSSIKISSDYNDYNESSSTSPLTPPPHTLLTGRIAGQNIMVKQESIGEKQIHVTEIVDYEDDNSTILSSEISLSSAAQQNDDEMEMTETLSQNDIGEVLSSPMEADRISDDFLLFQENMVVDISGGVQYSDKEEADEEYTNIVIRSPTTSDDEFIMQGRTKKYNILNITETSGSPEQDANTEPSTEPEDEELTQPYEESEVVIIDQPVKSPDEQISTKEDFEELIDEGSRKEKLRYDTKSTTDFHKFTSTSVYSFPPKAQATTIRQANVITSKLPQKISLITAAPIIQNFTARSDPSKPNTEPQQLILTPTTKISTTTAGSKLTSIILTHNPVRSNILSVGPKIVSSSPGITIVSASTSQIASILPSKFTVPVISASAVRQLPNVKVIDKPSSSLSLTTHDSSLPKKIFEDDSVSPDSANFDDEKKDLPSATDKLKTESTTSIKVPIFTNTIIPSNKVDGTRISQATDTSKQTSIVDNGKNKSETIEGSAHLIQNQLTHIVSKEKVQKLTKSSPPVVIHHAPPELKMTAQVIQETPSHMQITATETVSTFDGTTEDKSVVISIPSPTPSQEQMLDNIALQALESRRREFDSFEDVLDMIENMQNPETSEHIEENQDGQKQVKPGRNVEILPPKEPSKVQMEINVTNASKQNIPQLSPLSQPTDLTTNMANASQQLRSLLSSLQTTTSSRTSNVETVVKTNNQKLINSSSSMASPIVASRVIQQSGQPSVLTNTSTVIVPNINKQKLTASSPIRVTQSPCTQGTVTQATPILSFLSNRTTAATQLSDNFKLTTTASSATSQPTATTGHSAPGLQKSSVISSVAADVNKKGSLTLTAMLQNQPAATLTTKSSADTITAASLLATPVSLSRTGFSPALAQAQPNAIIAAATAAMNTNSSTNINVTTSSVITSPFRGITSTTNLLHTQLTKSRPKSLDDIKELKSDESGKTDTAEMEADVLSSLKQELGGCKYSSIPTPSPNNKCEDSQNVLLKKLLQNTACASTQSPPPNTTSTAIAVAPSVEAQKSSPPTLSSLLPPVIKTEPQSSITTQSRTLYSRAPIRETSFVSSPVIQQIQTTISNSIPTQQLHIEIKKCAPASRSSSRDDILSPPTPRSSCSQDSSLQTPPLVLKKEPSNFLGNLTEVKKEILDETSQHSEISDQGKLDTQIKEELESGDTLVDKTVLDKEELKKQKRRMYNQKRRQNQILNKEVNKPNKRPRKNSKLDEDYDSYIDSVLAQIRHLPVMTVSEPILLRNYGVMSIFGSGDLSKVGTKLFDSRYGDLTGSYGNAVVPGFSDFYNTKPYSDEESLPEKPPASTQRGFYDQEFPLIRFDSEDDKKFDLFSREDTPDSIISSSSPECLHNNASDKYLGLKLISDDEEEEPNGRISPEIPIIKPIPIRLKPAGLFLKDSKVDIDDKENICQDMRQDKLRPESTPTTPLKESENIKVTLTLTSSAAENIVGVLRDLANILQIPPPTAYQIIDRTSSPTGQKFGMYRTKGKDGKEGAPIDIQSILNGAAKFCKHCDVVILNNMIRKKVSDLPFLAKDSELLSEGEELYFCSSACYMQFALMHRSPLISEDKAAAIIDHLSQKSKHDYKHHGLIPTEISDQKPTIINRISVDSRELHTDDLINSNFSPYFHVGFKQTSKFGPIKLPEPTKIYRNITYKFWVPGCLQPNQKHKKPTDKEMMEMLYQMGITVTPPKMPDDTRRCMFCQVIGDGVADGPARLLNFDVDKWVHLNCALWSDGVYETVNGALMNLDNAIQQSLSTACIHCSKMGATIRCFKTRCSSVYHLSCAVRDNCVFFKNKTVYCIAHVPKNEKDNELTTLSVGRRVYVNRDENRQVAAVMHHSDTNNLLRVGSLIFLNVGQLLPHQLQNFHTPNFIYPIGYKIIRFYWSMRYINKRCRYICSIHDSCGRPEFKILVQEHTEEDVEFKEQTSKGAWNPILERIAAIRRENKCLQMFPKYISGEDLFGLTEPAIVRVLESLPGIETLADYKFKYGRNPLLELPLAINPTGAARTEPRLRHQTHWKRPHTQRTTGSSSRPMFGPSLSGPSTATSFGEIVCPYSKQFVHSKSSQYKKMKQEWRNNVYLARSKIQGLGLYAARDLEKHTMVIEYIGEVIRTELSECREKQYEAKNRGIYMFRLDDDRVVDATLSGGLARYINHSCNPNCVAETVEIDRDLKIIIFAKRRIQRGEELAYDYKFDIEDDQNKISCMCGAPNCRKWMN